MFMCKACAYIESDIMKEVANLSTYKNTESKYIHFMGGPSVGRCIGGKKEMERTCASNPINGLVSKN